MLTHWFQGTCPSSSAQLPLSSLGGADGQGQMKHFVQDDGLNVFRLPTSWQYLVNSNNAASAGNDLDATNAGKYDQLVRACLATGAYCMLDLHNFARFNGGIVGQGGPTDAQFAGLWGQLAAKYADEPNIVFELMNEPHDLDVGAWAQTCQHAVTAIRAAGAASQLILLPGTNFDSAATLVASGSADALLAVTNPDGSTTNLLLDVHKYLDVDNSGTHAACVTDNVGNFTVVADYLRAHGRQGFVSETGASSQASCVTDFCAQNAFINANADVFVGYVGWAAGGFDSSYVLSLTPSKQGGNGGGQYVDNALMTECVLGPYRNSSETVPSGPPPPPPPYSTTGTGTGIVVTTGTTESASTTATASETATTSDTTTEIAHSGYTITKTGEGGSTRTGVTHKATATATGTTLLLGTGSPSATTTGPLTIQTVNAARAVRVMKEALIGVVVVAALL
ncbi:cellulase [Niveomyces insectorum RCEF 264]|uniref:cellulase n=1 Tax=Niveomyces insectorum RCEF 264 TaxID=1081102 RepID=A0A167QDE4_9HYPO|nr:cellulase [Niveomyces insectorum RCEF 264]